MFETWSLNLGFGAFDAFVAFVAYSVLCLEAEFISALILWR